MPPSRTPALPLELTDWIIDFLHSDRSALRACALTCPAWLPSSRHHIFRDVAIHRYEAYARLVDALDSTPVLGAYIRTLSVDVFQPYDFRPCPRRCCACALQGYGAPGLAELAPHLTALDVLRLSHLSWGDLDTATRQCFATRFRSVTRLYVGSFSIDTRDELGRFLGAFPRLAQLELNKVHHDYRAAGTFSVPPPANLKRLTLRRCEPEDTAEIAKWVLRAPAERRPSHVAVYECPALGDVEAMRKLAAGCGPVLEHAHFDCRGWASDEDAYVTLGANPNLRTLRLDSPNRALLASVLRSITSTSVETITLTAHSLKDMRSLGLEQLDEALRAPRFASVRRLHVGACAAWIHGGSAMEAFHVAGQETVRAALPALYANGVARFASLSALDKGDV